MEYPGLAFDGITDEYRKIVVLMDGADALDDDTRARRTAAGRQIFWNKKRALDELSGKLMEPGNSAGVRQFAASSS